MGPSGMLAFAIMAALIRLSTPENELEVRYHMGPVLSQDITVYTIWYGQWAPARKQAIKDFLLSISDAKAPTPSAAEWWKTARLYKDQTGANVTGTVLLGSERDDRYSQGTALTRLTIQNVLRNAVTADVNPLRPDPTHGLYFLFTSEDVTVQDFCRAICGYHYFTFPSIVGYTLPYVWVGDAGRQCPEKCAYPFAVPSYMRGVAALKPPNGDFAVDGMINIVAHELAEVASNPLVNAWYAGDEPTAPTEIADLCVGVFGTGGGAAASPGRVLKNAAGAAYNVNGMGREYLIQWIWNPVLDACYGPNAL